MVNLPATVAQGHWSHTTSRAAAAFSPARWPRWTLIPAAAAAFAIGGLVAMLTSGGRAAPTGPVDASPAVEDSDEQDGLTASAAAVPMPPADTPTPVEQRGAEPVVADEAPVAETVQPEERRPVAADTTTEPTAPAIATSPSSEAPVTPPRRPEQRSASTEAPAPPPPPRAPSPAGLRGWFRDPAGPVAGLTVKLMRGPLEVVIETLTSDTGIYEFFPITPGEYTLRFFRDQTLVYERPALEFGEAQMRTLGVSSPTPLVPAPPTAPSGGL